MENGIIKVYCGEGKGKTQAAIGRALICASEGKDVYIVQFLKGRTSQSLEFMKRLEPEIQIFRFEKELDLSLIHISMCIRDRPWPRHIVLGQHWTI